MVEPEIETRRVKASSTEYLEVTTETTNDRVGRKEQEMNHFLEPS
jgi:hypothetical protein